MRRIGAIFLGVLLIGCGSGIDCPIDPPSCCYDGLFGCGTFDLPQGCSCSQYRGFSIRTRAHKSSPTVKNSWNGNFSGALSKRSSSCSNALSTIRGKVKIEESRGRVKISIPGYGVLRGRSDSGGFTASGSYTSILAGGSFSATVQVKRASNGSHSTSTWIKHSPWFSKTQCSMSYSGTIKRQP